MRIALATLLAAQLALGPAGTAHASPPAGKRGAERSKTRGAQAGKSDEQTRIDSAIDAWAKGDWPLVRAMLEPLVQGGRDLSDPLLTETALRYLADATLQDKTLSEDLRVQLAVNYIDRLLQSDPNWRPPEATHGPELYRLVNEQRDKREREVLDACLAQSAGCTADLEELQVRYNALERTHGDLKRAYGEQEVEVREKVARNRAIALVPFGVGHFYNGNTALGASFLAGEIALGATGLALMITRLQGCERVDRRMITCDISGGMTQQNWVLRRNLESFFGWAFLSVLVVDIVVAQILFEPYRTEATRRVKRSELDSDGDKGARKGRKRRNRKQARGTLMPLPMPTLLRGGAGLGVSFHF